MKILEYKILAEAWASDLEELVNRYIQNGWQPYGSIASSDNNRFQPMVKYEKYTRKTGP